MERDAPEATARSVRVDVLVFQELGLCRGERWSCFVAEREGRRVKVCERIHDGDDGRWTDTSAWFWASQYGGGPWWAVTVVAPIEGET